MLMSPHAADISDMVIEEGVKIVTTGAGNPGIYMDKWKAAGITVIPVVPSVALAKRLERVGADAVIVEGTEAGGHIGEIIPTLIPNTTQTSFVILLLAEIIQLFIFLQSIYSEIAQAMFKRINPAGHGGLGHVQHFGSS